MARTTRASAQRARKESKVVYTPPNVTEIDPIIEEHFANEGAKLRWVRWQLNGREDVKNLTRKKREGWSLVTADELPEGFAADFEIGQDGRTEGIIINGDVALAKIPVEMAEARKEYYEGNAVAQEEAVNLQLQRNSSREMPILNESRSKATTGRKPADFGATEE